MAQEYFKDEWNIGRSYEIVQKYFLEIQSQIH